jgi:hypothetical protein
MSSELINHSEDLKRLRDEGYNIQVRGGYLVVNDIPYVNSKRELLRGTLISKLNVSGNTTLRPDEHQALFVGEYPCHADGSQMTELVNQAVNSVIDDRLTAQFMFSRKPDSGQYVDYFEKMSAYDALLSSQATQLDETATARTRRVEEAEDADYPFHYLDTASARADINGLSSKLAMPAIAIIGLGGTGSYILDLVAKTHVHEIHLFDGDVFANHNAFRAPGAATIAELRQQQNKAIYFANLYSKMRRRVVPHDSLSSRQTSLCWMALASPFCASIRAKQNAQPSRLLSVRERRSSTLVWESYATITRLVAFFASRPVKLSIVTQRARRCPLIRSRRRIPMIVTYRSQI